MIVNSITSGKEAESTVKSSPQRRNVQQAQEVIYRFLLDIVKQWSPDDVLQEFKSLFIHQTDSLSSASGEAVYEIIIANDELEFRNTIKRCCYILVNNWETNRQHKYIQELVGLFADQTIKRKSLSSTLNRFRSWLQNFVSSQDYHDLKVFASKHDEQGHWVDRYSSYLLVAQYAELKNPVEQREAARKRARELKQQFKFDLAMYIARSQCAIAHKVPKNPTVLGNEVLRLIKAIVAKRGPFSYANIANIFINQTQDQNYKQFKQSLHKYLLFSVGNKDFIAALQLKLSNKLDFLYEQHHDCAMSDALILRTCNRVIDYLTTENQRDPSPLFILLMSQGNALTLVIVLLKIILICKYSYSFRNMYCYFDSIPRELLRTRMQLDD